MHGQPWHNTRQHARLPHSFLGMDANMTSQPNVALCRKLRGPSPCFVYAYDVLSVGFCKTRHWQTPGRSGAGISRLHCTRSQFTHSLAALWQKTWRKVKFQIQYMAAPTLYLFSKSANRLHTPIRALVLLMV